MSVGKLNYDELNEQFCYWFFKVNGCFPPKSMNYKTKSLVKQIWKLKRNFKEMGV